MTSILRKCFFKKKSNLNINERVYNVSDYDEMYASLKNLLGWLAIRMTHNISNTTTKYWDMIYWFEFLNVMVGSTSELVSMASTASSAQTFHEITVLFRMMPCYGSAVLSLFKSIKMVTRRPVYENLVNELRSMWPQGEVSEEEHRIISASTKQLNFIVKGYYWSNNALLIFFLTPPFVMTLARYLGYDRPMDLHFLYWLPFNPFQSVYFEIMLVLQTWHAMVVIWMNVSWDIMFCMFVCHITIQFDLLAHRVRRLFYVKIDQQLVRSYPLVSLLLHITPAVVLARTIYNMGIAHVLMERLARKNLAGTCGLQILSILCLNRAMAAVNEDLIRTEGEGLNFYSDHYWDVRHQKELSDIVFRHISLIRLAGDVEKMFSLALLVNFLNSSIIICFCGFCCILIEKWNEMAYKSFLVTALSQTWLLCWYGQKLIDSSKGLSEALYNCGWYNGSKRVKSAVLIMLHRAQMGVYVTTYGFSAISLASYTTIIKSAWSYFTLLLNFFKDKSMGL